MEKNDYLKVDNGTRINEKHIRWIKKIDDCLHICVKSDGCTINVNTHKACKYNSRETYDLLNDNIFK